MATEKKNVFVVTVTYGARAHFVELVVEKLIALRVFKIIIVDNASSPESRNRLNAISDRYTGKIDIISLTENLGSSGGFKKGLERAYAATNCDFVWMLDDDNLPVGNALGTLLNVYALKNELCCLVSLRKNRLLYRKIFNKNDVKRKFNPNNGFINYSLRHWIRKKFLYSNDRSDIVSIPYGPYGGMFFPKTMLSVIGFPMESMYLYRDDHEFSHRIVKAGYKIYLCRESVVDDLEVSWQGRKKYRFFGRFMIIAHGDETKAYYMIRNSVFFERKFYVTNKVEYAINKFFYTVLLYLVCKITGKPDRFRLFERACADGKDLVAMDEKKNPVQPLQ